MLQSSRMFLFIFLLLASIILGFVLIYFTGLADISPYFWFLYPIIGLLASGILISILWGLLLLFALKYKKVECAGKGNRFYQFCTVLLTKLMLLGSWSILKKKGFGKIPKEGTCLYLFNHTSFIDCWMLLATIHPHLFSIVSALAMKKIPLVGNLATALGCIYVDREDPKSSKKMIDISIDYLTKQNTSVALSPEGSVNRSGELKPFKNGCFKIAIQAKRPIVLLYFEGIGKMDRRKNIFEKCPISARVITVIYPETYADMNASELAKYTEEIYKGYQKKQHEIN